MFTFFTAFIYVCEHMWRSDAVSRGQFAPSETTSSWEQN